MNKKYLKNLITLSTIILFTGCTPSYNYKQYSQPKIIQNNKKNLESKTSSNKKVYTLEFSLNNEKNLYLFRENPINPLDNKDYKNWTPLYDFNKDNSFYKKSNSKLFNSIKKIFQNKENSPRLKIESEKSDYESEILRKKDYPGIELEWEFD